MATGRQRLLHALRSVAAVVVGYAVMVVLLALSQEGLFGGVSYHGSSLPVLAIAGSLSVASAAVGGLVAAAIAGRAPLAHAAVMGVLVAVETSALLATGELEGPLWFDLAASGSLVVGILLGAKVWSVIVAKRGAGAAAATGA